MKYQRRVYFYTTKAVKDELEEWFGRPRPVDINFIKKALRGVRVLMLHLKQNRVTVLHRGARTDRPLPRRAQDEILKAFREKGYNFLVSILPRVGRSSAELRVFR